MKTKPSSDWTTIKDPELIAWVAGDSDELRELIVEARLPERKVTFRNEGGRPVPSGSQSESTVNRESVLAALDAFLTELLDHSTTVLKAAGAIAVKASSRQVRQFANHHWVKAIRPNRRLR